jgi:hypothetical protein
VDFASPQQSRGTGNKPPLPDLEIRWQRGKIVDALNANILSGSFRSRTPRLGGVAADIGGFRRNSASIELLQPALRLCEQGRDSGGQITFIVSYYLLPIS